ncbi:MAG: DUF308 domain-containing protein [Bacilli bacterium]|nr:DUF308 domain-containing protein [Bacilli bacterium]
MNKTNKTLKIITASTIAIASLVMVILAIVNLAKNGSGESETIAFRIIACVLLVLASILSTCLVVGDNPRHFDARLVIYNGLLLGTGIFVVLPVAGEVADIMVGYLIPCFLIGLGVFFVVATIISLIKKINNKNTDVVALILGILLLVAGILLLCYAEKTTKVLWLVIGIILLASSIIALVNIIKKDKVKTIDVTDTTKN